MHNTNITLYLIHHNPPADRFLFAQLIFIRLTLEINLNIYYSGEKVELVCKYDVGRDAIYSVKWYKVKQSLLQGVFENWKFDLNEKDLIHKHGFILTRCLEFSQDDF